MSFIATITVTNDPRVALLQMIRQGPVCSTKGCSLPSDYTVTTVMATTTDPENDSTISHGLCSPHALFQIMGTTAILTELVPELPEADGEKTPAQCEALYVGPQGRIPCMVPPDEHGDAPERVHFGFYKGSAFQWFDQPQPADDAPERGYDAEQNPLEDEAPERVAADDAPVYGLFPPGWVN